MASWSLAVTEKKETLRHGSGRHNLTRRALLGAAAGVPIAAAAGAPADASSPFGLSLSKFGPSPVPEEGKSALRQAQGERMQRTNTRWTRALAALRRLLRAPAPDLRALGLKIALAVDEQAWELPGAETLLTALKADALRLIRAG